MQTIFLTVVLTFLLTMFTSALHLQTIGIDEVSTLLSVHGTDTGKCDTDGNNVIDVEDLLAMMVNFGGSLPVTQPPCSGVLDVPSVNSSMWSEIIAGAPTGWTTYQFGLATTTTVNAVALVGTLTHPLTVPAAYQNTFGVNVGGINHQTLMLLPQATYDSWLTVGLTNGESGLSSVGVVWDDWDTNTGIDCTDCGVFWMNPTLSTLSGKVVLGQVTLANDEPLDISAVVLQKDGEDFTRMNAHWTNATPEFSCPAGTVFRTYSDAGNACLTCVAGTFSAAGSDTCTSCAAGTVSAMGAATCVDTCPAGSENDNGVCSSCAAGTFSADGAAVCSACAAGTVSAMGAATLEFLHE
jgi:hypothetical protein